MANDSVWASAYTKRRECTKANGKMIIGMAGAWKGTQMAISMKENSKIINRTGKVFISGSTVRCMKVSGAKA